MEAQEQVAKAAKTRRMTICNKGFARENGRYVFFPIISLSGKWLKEQGFKSGQMIDIVCEDSKLIITIVEEQRLEGG
ncbi:Toxin SymE, type I toxin-antitoxin system [Pseudarcicella hirudinis]|uniref:Toxin SymE, type I toxin-antitoxin system n=1 Tax=Pseudarcicella hirudinis TaxID=1079859 RepID=A0A1I5MSY4_9BACT|nr:SymE family type I addiction module toxin [Pseudarcicella hirudinis]SFP12678.1 Toxin SymE, type I toxin-antitoxin system [Pseudarcicella hirudinis]